MTDIATLSVKVTTDGITIANDQLKKLGTTATKTEKQTSKLGKTAKAVGNAFKGLSGLLAAAGVGAAARSLVDYTDRMAGLQGQLKLVTSSQGELNEVYNRALALANETGQSLEATVNLYARMARATEELALSQDDLFTVTKAINQSFIVSGAAAQEAAAATLQLSQGLAAGALRGEELNSVMENSPRLARALADGLGVGIGKLREMGSEGELTAERVTGALIEMADEIDREFQDMPITIGRVTNEIKNHLLDAFGGADVSPAIEALDQLADKLADPAVKGGLRDLAGLFALVVVEALSAVAAVAEFVATPFHLIGEGIAGGITFLRENFELFHDDLDDMGEALVASTGSVGNLDGSMLLLNQRVKAARELFDAASRELAEMDAEQIKAGASSKEYGKSAKELEKALVKVQKQHEKNTKTFESGHKILDDMVAKNEEYIDALEFENMLLGKTEREQALLTAQRKLGTASTEEQKQAVEALASSIYDQNAAMEEAEAATKAMEEAQKPFQDALLGTVERIDGAFADAWRGAFDSFDSFKDSLVDAFKNLLAELAHLAITRPIVMSIAGSFGLGTTPSALAGVSGFGGTGVLGNIASFGKTAYSAVTGGLGSLTSLGGGGLLAGGLNSLGDVYTGVGNYFGAGSSIGNAALETGRGYSYGSVGSGIANVGLNLGAGYLGNLAGGAAFGETSGIGSTAGGAVGSIWGPVGTAVGSFIGTGLEKVLGNVFGFGGKGGNNAGQAFFDLGEGTVDASGIGKNFDQENVDTAQQLAQTLQLFADVVGGSDFSGKIKVGNTSGIKLDGEKFKTIEDFFDATFDRILASSDGLSDGLRELISSFDGTTEETLVYASTLMALNTIINDNAVDTAITDFAAAMDAAAEAQRPLIDRYFESVTAIGELIVNYDGSIAATEELTTEMALSAAAAYELATGIIAIQDAVTATLTSTMEQIRAMVAVEEELPETSLREQRTVLFDELKEETDPEEIFRLVKELEKITLQMFEEIEDATTVQADNAVKYLEGVDHIAQRQLDLTLDAVRESQEALHQSTETMLSAFAANVQDAGKLMLDAAVILQDFAKNLSTVIPQYNFGEVS